jgi:hypothetical protein
VECNTLNVISSLLDQLAKHQLAHNAKETRPCLVIAMFFITTATRNTMLSEHQPWRHPLRVPIRRPPSPVYKLETWSKGRLLLHACQPSFFCPSLQLMMKCLF